MKTVFVINPNAGKKKNIKNLIEKINEVSLNLNSDSEVYITKRQGDAETFVRNYCEEKGAARFIACGGDGTLSEVLNGAINFEDAEIGVMPIGTGNDFCRNFKNIDFKDIKSQFLSHTRKCDAIKYTDKNVTRFGVNMFNIGFDCNVADMKEKLTKKTFLKGSLAYFIAIFIILVKKKGANLKIVADGTEKHSGKLLLTSLANGSFCGGGIMSNPLADLNDGLININIVKNVSRLRFITLLPFYMNGKYIKLKNIDKIITTEKYKKIVITPLDSEMRLCTDGEISTVGETTFEIKHNAFNLVVPQYTSCII